MIESNDTQCGTVAIIGRPNVGKSTLLNCLIGQKISITAHRPQTTRHSILGIKTLEKQQILYVDTPGIHLDGKRMMNQYLNNTASSVLHDVDLILFVIDRTYWTDEDEHILGLLQRIKKNVFLLINKIDLLKNKDSLLPHLKKISEKYNFDKIIPISAKKRLQIKDIEQTLLSHLPVGEFWYPEDFVTDKSERFIVAEIIREKLTRRLGQELPYSLAVEIEAFKTEKNIIKIYATIWIEKKGQKGIVVGKKGQILKEIGQQSREDMERLLGSKVFLQLWVKIKEGWSDSERLLDSLGYK
ncbi:MAG: GTPase Era [Methylococcales bacterium]|jgi:GTPase|nr:GTPase Era [Methylococcales bacterium]